MWGAQTLLTRSLSEVPRRSQIAPVAVLGARVARAQAVRSERSPQYHAVAHPVGPVGCVRAWDVGAVFGFRSSCRPRRNLGSRRGCPHTQPFQGEKASKIRNDPLSRPTTSNGQHGNSNANTGTPDLRQRNHAVNAAALCSSSCVPVLHVASFPVSAHQSSGDLAAR